MAGLKHCRLPQLRSQPRGTRVQRGAVRRDQHRYQNVTGLTINPGDTYCASATVRTQYPDTGARGTFAVWLLGGANENGNRPFSNLRNAGDWTDVHTCATATSAHTAIRVQFYPAPNTPTLDIDDVHLQ